MGSPQGPICGSLLPVTKSPDASFMQMMRSFIYKLINLSMANQSCSLFNYTLIL